MSAIEVCRDASGRGPHDAKITVYLTAGEQLRLDLMILELRRVYGIKVDRSQFVREVLAGTSLRAVADRVRDRRAS